MSARRITVLALTLAAAFSCRPDDQRTETMDPAEALQQQRESLPPELVAHLDSGSTLYRADDFEGALEHYRRVTELDEDVAAGWFGVYMAEQALGNEEAAREALERAQSVAPGATLIHPAGEDTIR